MPSLITASWAAWRATHLPPLGPGVDQDLAASIVKLGIRVLRTARSAESLGLEREGTGVVIDAAGLILTIGYLLIESESIIVMTQDGRVLPASVAGFDHVTGFGLVRTTQPLGGRALEFGDVSRVEELSPAVVAGHPGAGGLSNVAIIARRPFTGWWEYALDNAIFAAPVRDNHSGTALINAEGQLVGIGSLWVGDVAEVGAAFPGNMFVPIDLLPPILDDLVAHGRRRDVSRPWLGLHTEEVRGHVVITQVLKHGPASHSGLKRGDVILAVSGRAIGGRSDFYQALWSSGPAGIEVKLQVWRNKSVEEVTVSSGDRLEYLGMRTAPRQ